MLKAVPVTLVLAVAVLTASCSVPAATAPATSTSMAVTASATPTPTPTPTAMTTEAAGALYLAKICKANAAGQAMSAVVQAEPFDLATAQAKAAVYRDAVRQVITEFTKPSTLWPAEVKPDVADFVEGYYTLMSRAERLAHSNNAQGFLDGWKAWTDPTVESPAHVASQKIRLKLGLAADGKASCNL